ncbi:MAG TPA: transposase [Skermanella sp.]|jgi:putative transposase|nr:transposase [Skermanella sp.]
MPRKSYADDLRRRVVQDLDEGAAVGDVIRKYGIAEATVYRWRNRFGRAAIIRDPENQRLEEENRRLRELYTEASLENQALRERLQRR